MLPLWTGGASKSWAERHHLRRTAQEVGVDSPGVARMRIRAGVARIGVVGRFLFKATMEIQGKWKNGSVKKENKAFLSNKKYPIGEGRIFFASF